MVRYALLKYIENFCGEKQNIEIMLKNREKDLEL